MQRQPLDFGGSVEILISSVMRAKRCEIEAKLSPNILCPDTTPDAIIGRSWPPSHREEKCVVICEEFMDWRRATY